MVTRSPSVSSSIGQGESTQSAAVNAALVTDVEDEMVSHHVVCNTARAVSSSLLEFRGHGGADVPMTHDIEALLARAVWVGRIQLSHVFGHYVRVSCPHVEAISPSSPRKRCLSAQRSEVQTPRARGRDAAERTVS